MRTVDSILTNFTAGELSPNMYGRTDIEKYYNGCMTMENFLVLPQGGAYRRPGSRYVASVKTASAFTRLVPFIFSTTQSYILEFGNLYMRVYYDGGQVQSGSTVYEVVTPYTTAQLPDLKFAQSADTLYIVHPSHEPRQLTRTAHTSRTLTALAWENGPFMKDNSDDSHTMTVTSIGSFPSEEDLPETGNVIGDVYLIDGNLWVWDGYSWVYFGSVGGTGPTYFGSTGLYGQTVRVTSSANMFTANDVGRWIKIRYTAPGSNIAGGTIDANSAYTSSAYSVDGEFELTWRYYESSSNEWEVQYSIDSGSNWDTLFTIPHSTANVTYTETLRSEDYNNVVPQIRFYAPGDTCNSRYTLRQIRENRNAYLKITTYSSATSVRAKVYKSMTQCCVPTNNWALGAWGTTPGYPSAVTFHQGRLVFAGTTSEPSKVWMSVSDDYPNFDAGEGDEDADAISLTPIASEVNNVMWMASKGNLLIGTAGDEWVFDGANITPTNPPHARRETNFGSAKWQAVIANGYVVFVQNGEKIVRQVQSDYDSDTYLAIDLTAMSDHITGDGISYLAYLKSPWSTIWTCRDDGELIGLTYVPEHKVFAWHRHDLGGDVESVACIPGEIWMVVKRTINSATVRYIERILPWDGTLNNSVFMDCAAKYSGTATATITGLSYLEGETVGIISNGKYVGTKVVDSGAITLDATTTHAWVGLPYTSTLKTINIEHANPPGTSQGAKRRIVHAIARLVNTVGGKVGFDASDADDIEYDDEGNPNVSTPELFTGDANPVLVTASSGRPQYLTIVQDKPYPFSVSAIVLRMEVQN